MAWVFGAGPFLEEAGEGVHVDGFDEDGAVGEGLADLGDAVVGGDENDAESGVVAFELDGEVRPLLVGEANVDDGGVEVVGGFDGFFGAGERLIGVALIFEYGVDGVPGFGIVLQEENVFGIHATSSCDGLGSSLRGGNCNGCATNEEFGSYG